MATDVDIANLALSHLGDDANIASLTEGSAQAAHCARFLPICRDTLLELHTWKFATRRATPAQVETWDEDAWLYAYAEPAECLRILGAYATGHQDDREDTLEFLTESLEDGTNVILANEEITTLRYTVRVTDPTKFPPLFVEALARLLAAAVAGPLIKGAEGRKAAQDQWAIFAQWFARATASDANQARQKLEPVASWIRARGYWNPDEEDPWMGERG